MKIKKNRNLKNFRSFKFNYLIVGVICGMQVGCSPPDSYCEVIEHFEDGSPKIERCIIDIQKHYYAYKRFYPNGGIEASFYSIDGKINGEFIEYYPSGNPESKAFYRNGMQIGDFFAFLEDGRIDYYNYFADDQAIYIRGYDYSSDTVQVSEGFIPIINFIQDTISESSALLEFDLSFPLPDSLFKNRSLVYAFEMKPLSQKDSLIVFPANEILLDNHKTLHCSLKLLNTETQIFYGHIYDKQVREISQPFEKVITVLNDEILQ